MRQLTIYLGVGTLATLVAGALFALLVRAAAAPLPESKVRYLECIAGLEQLREKYCGPRCEGMLPEDKEPCLRQCNQNYDKAEFTECGSQYQTHGPRRSQARSAPNAGGGTY